MKTSKDLPIYAFSKEEEEFPFHVIKFDSSTPQTLVSSPHRHNFYLITYITAGSGLNIIDFSPYLISPDTLYFISPGQVHIGQYNQPFEGYDILFTEEFLTRSTQFSNKIYELSFFHSLNQRAALVLHPSDAAKIKTIIFNIDQEYMANEPDRLSVLRAHLHILVASIQRMYVAASLDGDLASEFSFVRKFNHFVSAHCITEKSLKTYAEKMRVSAGYLSNRIKALTGYSPGKMIRAEIALEAKRLLIHTDLTVAEIGYRLKFDEASAFGRFFKRTTGLSPNAFREQIRNKE
jgi:AraC family transcriptional regulator, transcriptional activator of pobA